MIGKNKHVNMYTCTVQVSAGVLARQWAGGGTVLRLIVERKRKRVLLQNSRKPA